MSGTRSERVADPDRHPYEGDEGGESSRKGTLKQWLQGVMQATSRHGVLVVAIVLAGFLLLAVYYTAQTPLYRVQTTLLAQRQQAVPSIVRASVPNELPTRGAFELVHRRENIVSLLKQTGLYQETKAPAIPGWRSKLRSAMTGAMNPALAEEDPLNMMVLRLNKALVVETTDGTVSISIDWPDAQQAYQLVEAAMVNFLEARQLQEITAIDDAITLLQGRVSTLRQELDAAIAGSATVRTIPVQSEEPASRSVGAPVAPPETDAQAVLKASLEAKGRALRDIEEFRRRRLSELQSQLEERRGVYAEAHPSVVALRKEIESFSGESQQITALRAEEQRLREEYNARHAADQPAGGGARTVRPGVTRMVQVAPGPESERVRDARFRYQQMVERLNGAQLDLDSARAAFKYRYTVVWPAEVPKRPVSPNPLKIFGLGGLAVLLAAPLAAAWLDHRSGRVLSRWQVEVGLDVPVLAEFDRRK
jgi:uncharacterized protein involved in exopolysaccharide biosynthesis